MGEAARTRRLYTLNPLGQMVWELLEKARSFDDLCAVLRARYPDTPPERVEADTRRFLEELEGLALLHRAPEDGAQVGVEGESLACGTGEHEIGR